MSEKSADIWVQMSTSLLTVKVGDIGCTPAFVIAYLRGRYNGGILEGD